MLSEQVTNLVNLPLYDYTRRVFGCNHQTFDRRDNTVAAKMEPFPLHCDVYFKCTACSECFQEEQVFFAHSRTWHCKILVSEGNSPSESTLQPSLENDSCVQTANAVKTEVTEILTEYDAETDVIDDQLASSHEYDDDLLLNKPNVLDENAHGSECIDVAEHPDNSETEAKHLVSFGANAPGPSTSSKPLWDSRQQQKKQLIRKEVPLRRPFQKNAPVEISPQNSNISVKQSQTFMSVTNQKQYQCNLCFYHTTRKTGLVRHIRQHTGEKPYQCSYCNKRFTRNFSLTKHLKVHVT